VRRLVRVRERIEETPSTVTLRFDDPTPASPGQFVMVWIPGVDELPMSLSYVGPSKGITVKVMGDASRRIQSIGADTVLGIRGPYGNRFDLSPRRILVVAGGSGAAVLAPAAEAAIPAGADVVVALGATTESELLFAERFRAMGAVVHLATDDGSMGQPGYVTRAVDGLLGHQEFDAVWTCGPEVMMRKVIVSAGARGTPVYCSVERWMKCGLGLCDACALGRHHVCIDGPVFPGRELMETRGFGEFFRDGSGRRRPYRTAPAPAGSPTSA
jgi:dihydroorotate dehydrogenase electron transfer subunit